MGDRAPVAFLAALACVAPAAGQMAAKNPLLTLSERAPAAPPKPPDAFPALRQDADHYWLVDFRHLASFAYSPEQSPEPAPAAAAKAPDPLFPPDSQVAAQADPAAPQDRIPARVRALDGKRVCILGYMLPVALDEKGRATQFLIIRSPLVCCFGVAPALNEWVVATMAGKGAEATQDVPLRFYGTLHVGEFYDGKVFTGLYRLDVERVAAP
jgi:hypothetical protein